MSLPTSAAPTTATATTTTATTPDVSAASGSRGPSSDQVDAAISKDNNKQQDATSPEVQGVRFGKCKWFNVAKGWGFLTPDDGGQEVFVHQSVIQMNGFRSLGEQEEVEFECKQTERGLEATRVSGSQGVPCAGSTFRPRTKRRFRRVRCYNCGEFANHIASKCEQGPQPKRCHFCKQEDHLFADCPMKKQTEEAPEDTGASSAT